MLAPEVSMSRRVGTGTCSAHHGELLQGVFPDSGGRATPALVTLPCPLFHARATFWPEIDQTVRAKPRSGDQDQGKARRAAEATLRYLGHSGWGGSIVIDSDIPRSRGLGSSTADVLATIRAVTDAAGVRLHSHDLSIIAVEAEHASDPLMYGKPVLFAHRHGFVLEALPGVIPSIRVLGFDTQPGGPGIDTLATGPPSYSDADLSRFSDMRVALRDALAAGDVRTLAAVATSSAAINQRYRPIPVLSTVISDYSSWGAVGVQAAHSGTVAGLIYPLQSGKPDTLGRAKASLARLGIQDTWIFDVVG